jgi:hypothetical protein
MIRSDFRGRRRAERRVKAGLWFLAASAAVPGVWALFSPRSFFTDFPGFGFAWVALEPPFNQHLVTDVGAFYCAFAVLFGISALKMDRRLTIPLLGAWLIFSVPHLLFHLFHLEGLESADAIGQSASLGVVILIPLLLLPLVARTERF